MIYIEKFRRGKKKILKTYLQKAWWNNTLWEEDGCPATPDGTSQTQPVCVSAVRSNDPITREVASVARLSGETQYGGIRPVYEGPLMLAWILMSMHSCIQSFGPEQPSGCLGRCFCEGLPGSTGFCSSVLSWAVQANSLSIAGREGSGDGFWRDVISIGVFIWLLFMSINIMNMLS